MVFFVYATQFLSTESLTPILSATKYYAKELAKQDFPDPHLDPYGEISLWNQWDKECPRGCRQLVKKVKNAYSASFVGFGYPS